MRSGISSEYKYNVLFAGRLIFRKYISLVYMHHTHTHTRNARFHILKVNEAFKPFKNYPLFYCYVEWKSGGGGGFPLNFLEIEIDTNFVFPERNVRVCVWHGAWL